MRSIANLSPMFWTRGTGKRLRGDPHAQLLAVYLATSPHGTSTGLFFLAFPSIVHDTGLGEAAVRAALARLAQEGFAFYDETDSVMYLPSALETQVGPFMRANDRRLVAILREAQPYIDHPFFRQLLRRYGATHSLSDKFPDVWAIVLDQSDADSGRGNSPPSFSAVASNEGVAEFRNKTDNPPVKSSHSQVKSESDAREGDAVHVDGPDPESQVMLASRRMRDPMGDESYAAAWVAGVRDHAGKPVTKPTSRGEVEKLVAAVDAHSGQPVGALELRTAWVRAKAKAWAASAPKRLTVWAFAEWVDLDGASAGPGLIRPADPPPYRELATPKRKEGAIAADVGAVSAGVGRGGR